MIHVVHDLLEFGAMQTKLNFNTVSLELAQRERN